MKKNVKNICLNLNIFNYQYRPPFLRSCIPFFFRMGLSLFCVPHWSARNFPFSGRQIENESGNVALSPVAPAPPRSPTPLALGQPVVNPRKKLK